MGAITGTMFAVLFSALAGGIWIGLTLGATGAVLLALFRNIPLDKLLAQYAWNILTTQELLALPMFILMGEILFQSRLSRSLFQGLAPWAGLLPGRLLHVNVVGCSIFAAICGSSTATAAAIGAMGVPEMRKRGYSPGLAGGLIAAGGTLGILIPPSITFILYGIVVEQSIGKLFIAGIVPGVLLSVLFALWVIYKSHRDGRMTRRNNPHVVVVNESFTWRDRFTSLPRILPFFVIITIVMIALYGGFATPSEVAGVGAFATMVMVILIYRCYRWSELQPILLSTAKESCMLMMIIAMAFLFTYVMSYLYISQEATQWLVDLNLSKWGYLFWIDILIVVLGFFLPPVAIILMVTPVVMPGLIAHGFDPIWFGVNMTIVMEMGLIHPPVGLNLFVIQGIAPDISLKDLMWGVTPFIVIMLLFIVVISIFPQIATWLPNVFF
jgi:C4-dicarboxylate transporter DctM subunit